jgi:hypothetical protein
MLCGSSRGHCKVTGFRLSGKLGTGIDENGLILGYTVKLF